MKAQNLDRDELLKENRKLIRQLRARFKNIEKAGVDISAPVYAPYKFKDLMANTPKDLRTMGNTDLTKLNRDLRYIKDLKTASLKGARKAASDFNPIQKNLDLLSKDTRDKYYDVYKHLYENSSLIEKFKYSALQEIFDEALIATSPEDLEQKIMALYDKIYQMQIDKKLSDNEAADLFEKAINSSAFEYFQMDTIDEEEFKKLIDEQF